MRSRALCLGLLALSISACGDDFVGDDDPMKTTDTALPCPLRVLLAERCSACHGDEPKFGAPMALVTREHLMAAALDGRGTVAERMVDRMTSDGARMPPPPDGAATQADVELIEQWIADGMPEAPADEHCDVEPHGEGGGTSVDCTPDVHLIGQAPFEMPKDSDDEQVCFGIDLPAGTDKRHITAIVPRIDNEKIVHHVLLMEAPTSVSPEPTSCAFLSLDWKLVYAWGPGTPAQELPAEAGFPYGDDVETHFVLQVHYNNLARLEGETDQSGIDLCTTGDLREHDADVMAFGGAPFNGIEPNATSQLSCENDIPAALATALPVTLVQSWPHMHGLGSEFRAWIDHPDGTTTSLVDLDDYDFFHQSTYPSPAQLGLGDKVHTQCTWENTTSSSVGFGEGTEDEMCFNFVTYYPRIVAPAWNWVVPSLQSTCEMQTF